MKELLPERLHKPVRAALGGAIMFLGSQGITPPQAHAQESPAQGHELALSLAVSPESASLPDISEAKTRVIQNLYDLIESKGKSTYNSLGIDPNEVEAYASSDETIFNTFRVWSTPAGESSIILVTGERPDYVSQDRVYESTQGLRFDLGNIGGFEAALNRIYEIDPNTIPTLRKFGLKAITGSFTLFKIYPWAASYDKQGIIGINELRISSPREIPKLIQIILEESRMIYNLHHIGWLEDQPKRTFNLEGRLADDPGVDKATWALSWAEEHKNQLSNYEYRYLVLAGNGQIAYYTRNPVL